MPELDTFYKTWESILTDNFLIMLDKLSIDPGAYFDSYNMLTMVIWLILGVLLNYAGLKSHKIIMPSVVGMLGGFFTALVVNSISQNETTILISTIVAGIIFGVLSLLLLRVSFLLIGVIFGLGLVATAGYDQIEAYVLAGLVFGIIAWFLYNFTIIIMTSFSGSVLLTYATMNTFVLLRSHSMEIYADSLGLYAKAMISPFIKPTIFIETFNDHKLDFILLFAFLLTGFTFQYGIKLLPVFGKKGKKPARKKATGTIITEVKPGK